MAEDEHVITVGSYEHRLMIAGLNGFRNDLIHEGRSTEDVERLLLKVIRAPTKRQKRREDRDAR